MQGLSFTDEAKRKIQAIYTDAGAKMDRGSVIDREKLEMHDSRVTRKCMVVRL